MIKGRGTESRTQSLDALVPAPCESSKKLFILEQTRKVAKGCTRVRQGEADVV